MVRVHFYLGKKTNDSNQNIPNEEILSISGILKKLVYSAADAEFGGLFSNTREGEVICTTIS